MKFKKGQLEGAFLIEIEPLHDERGHFSRTYCRRVFADQGVDFEIVQSNLSFNLKKGTLRGMHFQRAPHEEAKLVSCVAGSIYDVIIDLRRDSPSFAQWMAEELSAKNGRMLYIPKGFAHGFICLEDASSVFYQMSEYYHSPSAAGVRWDDPAFAIAWPPLEKVISERDNAFANFAK